MSEKYLGVDIDYKTKELIIAARNNKCLTTINKYIKLIGNDMYIFDKLNQIYIAIQENIDPSLFFNKEYRWECLRELRIGLVSKIDISLYNNIGFNQGQMKSLREGIMRGVDITQFNDISCSSRTMDFLINCASEGVPLYQIMTTDYNLEKIKVLKRVWDLGVDTKPFILSGLKADSLKEIVKSIEYGLKYDDCFKNWYSSKDIAAIRTARLFGIDLSKYDLDDASSIETLKVDITKYTESFDVTDGQMEFLFGEDYEDIYDCKQIEILKECVFKGYDYEILTAKKFSWEQMEEILFGFEDKLDVTSFANESLSDIEMNDIRTQLLEDKINNEIINKINKNMPRNSKFKKYDSTCETGDFVFSKDKGKYIASRIIDDENIIFVIESNQDRFINELLDFKTKIKKQDEEAINLIIENLNENLSYAD